MSFMVLVIAIVCLVGAFLYHASAPIRKERKEIIEVAEKYAGLKQPGTFYFYDTNQTYYTIEGKNDHHEEILVTVPKDGDDIRVVKQKSGVTEQDIVNQMHKEYKPHKISKVAFGYVNSTPVWEVTVINKNDTVSYYTFRFDNGKLFNKIKTF